MIEYLHGSSQSAQLWTLHSLAVKAALQIGLHSADASRHLTLLEREMHKRTWYQVIMNDNSLAAKFGRPMTIPPSLQKRLDPPQDISDVFPTMYASRSVIATSVDAFKCGVELSHLTCQVISQLYDDNAGGNGLNHVNTFDTLRLAFDLSWKLSQWCQSVPPDLRPKNLTITSTEAAPASSSSSPIIEAQRLRVVLSLRYYGLCTLVERPVLLQFLAFQDQLSEPDHAPGHNDVDTNTSLHLLCESGLSSLRRCIRACRECIALAKAIVDRWQNHKVLLSGAWWLTAYHAFGASLTLYTILLIVAAPAGTGTGTKRGGRSEFFSDLLSEEELAVVRSALSDAADLLSRSSGSLVISRCHDCLVNFLRAYDSVVAPEQQSETHSTAVQNNHNLHASSTGTSASASIDNTMPPPQGHGQGQGHRQDHVSGDGHGGGGVSSGYGFPIAHDVDYFTGTGTSSSSLAASLLGDFTGVPLDFGGHWGDPSLPYM